MKNILKILFLTLITFTSAITYGQETLDAGSVNSFDLGGDQNSNIGTINLLSFGIIDIEPDPNNSIDFSAQFTDLEAGLPATAPTNDGVSVNEELWLNYTYRESDDFNSEIVVYTNQPVPNGIVITLTIVSISAGGNFEQKPEDKNPIILSEIEAPLVLKLKSGYTEDGKFSGYQLRYSIGNNNSINLPPGFEVIYEIRPQ
ncbi:hypothetical protein [uncultured Flavobacterium sp.]|uniref:hypothetical protein n=1 Tax=uncultured Flavobacterium sp. TaxID=165435 RepID=UPI0030ED71F4|tara:strand:+ start:7692 stop:8294 length:603 start_codon:yes stop_codon:yes gene_type:complete